MKSLKIIALLLISCFSLPSLANIELISNSSLNLLVVNGSKAKVDTSLFSSTQTAELPNGENQIVFRYSYTFSRGDNHERIDSSVIIAKFNAQDTSLAFQFPKFNNAAEARNKIDELNWSLIDTQTNKPIPLVEDTLVTNGMQLGRNFVRETQDYNGTSGAAAVTVTSGFIAASSPAVTQVTMQTTEPSTKTSNQSANSSDNTAEEMLYFWYNKADAETQARFKAYINKN